MTSRLDALALANVLVLLVGCGLLPILRLARTRRELLARLPLAYAVGLAAVGIIAAELALVGVPVGRLALVLLAAGSLALGLPGLPAGERARLRRPRAADLPALILLAFVAAIAVQAARLAWVKPLVEPDGWQVWGARARALYLFGHPAAPVFTDPTYRGLRQPILLPALEALDFHFRHGVDGTLVHLQLFLFAAAFAGGAWGLLRRVTGPFLLAASLLAIVAAPAFFHGLLESDPEIPLAIFAALGTAALAAWLRSGDTGLLAGAALFLSAATLTSAEGESLALAALVAASLVARRERLQTLGIAAAVVVATDLTWRLWLGLEDVGGGAGRPGATALWHGISSAGSWSYLVPFFLVGLAGALVERHFRRALFAASWVVFSLAALRVLGGSPSPASSTSVGGLAIGGALLVPLLLHAGPLAERSPVPARTIDPLPQAVAWALRCFRHLRRSWGLPHRTPETLGQAPPSAGFPWRKPRRELLLLALVAAAALSPVFADDAQDVARVCLSKALVHLRVSDNVCFNGPYGRDVAVYRGHTYSDKAPGMSVIEFPTVAAVGVPGPDHWAYESVRLWVVRVLSSGVALILCAFLVGRMSEGLAPGYGGIALVTFALGTLIAPLGAANFEHGTAGLLGLASLALAWRRRPLEAGLAAGAAVFVAYEAAIIAAILAVYVLATQGARPALRFLVGTLPGALLLGAYNWVAFDAPWRFSYSYKSGDFASQQSSGFFGIHLPYLHAIHLFFYGRGGLLVISPVVVAAGAGLVLLARRHRAEAVACAAVVVAFGLVEWGYFDPYGGLSPGPRFFIPALPFLALGLGPAFSRSFRLTIVLAVLSIVPMTALTLTWANSAPFQGSIWHELRAWTNAPARSWLVDELTSNILTQIGASRGQAATFVAIAAAAAFALALPVTLRKGQRAAVTNSS